MSSVVFSTIHYITISISTFNKIFQLNDNVYKCRISDGRKPYPINHGPSSSETFLEDAARVCQEYMDHDPEEVRFTMIALVSNE
jgi:hypothetical protein